MKTSFAQFLVKYTLNNHFGSNKSAMARYYNRTYDDLHKAFKRIEDGCFSSFLVEVLQSYAMDEFDLAEAKTIYRKWRKEEGLHTGKCPALKGVHKLRRELIHSMDENKSPAPLKGFSKNVYVTEAQCPMLRDGAICIDYHKWLADQTYDLCVETCKYACTLKMLKELGRICVYQEGCFEP